MGKSKSSASRKMRKPLDAVSERYVAALKLLEAEQREMLEKARETLPAPGYAIPMAAHLIERRANDAVDHVAPWGFADFSALFRLLAETLVELSHDPSDSEMRLFIALVGDEDPAVALYLLVQYGRLLALNERVSVEGGMRTITLNGSCYRSTIADSRRRSAITLLRLKALYLEHSGEERTILDTAAADPDSPDAYDTSLRARLTLMLDMREIDVLRKGLPATWDRMLTALAITETSLLSFLAFVCLVPGMVLRWFTADRLFEHLQDFTQDFDREPISRAEFDRLLDLFASEPATARRIGSAVPFFKIGGQYRTWPFVYHAMLPELVFVSLVQSKRPDIWSSTFGSDLARAADYLAAQLPRFEGITVVTRRTKTGVGDIDIAVYDRGSGELLICEIKTVFDRFRTEFQASNFTEDRVNFDKAVAQLNTARAALLAGTWPLRDVVGRGVPEAPMKVHRMALLWRDHVNPSLDGGDFVPACDFATFRLLFERCKGSPGMIAESVGQLEKIFWVSRYRDDFWIAGDEQLTYAHELETDALPPQSFLDTLPLNEVVQEEVRTLPKFPEDWSEQMAAAGDDGSFGFRTQL